VMTRLLTEGDPLSSLLLLVPGLLGVPWDSGKTGPTRSLMFWRRRFLLNDPKFRREESISSTSDESAHEAMYSWTRMSRVARSRS
jgi:hypothetical protein